ncbi:MAG: hypothetical protein NTX66_02235 [Candidatus Falkowbacteria bacterium]|nr:hypothetical protein [Candidatus Falkowbacteria bacterium]
MVLKPKNKKLYNDARSLRNLGFSYGVIAKRCQTSKSNVSLWCRDIKLTSEQYKRLIGNKIEILKLGSKKIHEKRQKEINDVIEYAKEEINPKKFNDFSFLVAGAMIYWGEGSKSVGIAITNADEKIIIFMLKWFEKFLNINIKKQIKAHLHIHDKKEDFRTKKYWSKLTGIPLQNFGKSFIKPQGTGHRTNVLPNGIIRIRIQGNGMENLRHRVMAWVDEIYKIITK